MLAGISVAGAHKLLGPDTDKILAAAETKEGDVQRFRPAAVAARGSAQRDQDGGKRKYRGPVAGQPIPS